jgi:hypothetical protein
MLTKLSVGLWLVVMTLSIAAHAAAQSDRGTITGTVTDPANAVVAGATVIATNTATGAKSETVTTETGNYTLASLPAGVYDLTVELPGFKRFISQGVRVQVAQTTRIDAVMEVGTPSETVTVTAEPSVLKTESAEQSTTISRERLSELPINFAANGAIRNPLSFVTLAPGARINGVSDVRVNGLPNSSFKVTVDGQDITSGNLQDRFDETLPSVEMMQEFTLQSSNFSAEFGQVGGGLFNFTARSGTNDFHGSAYGYFVNEAFNAGEPFRTNPAKPDEHLRPRNRKFDYGFTVGGPVRVPKVYDGRNRSFFFFNLERYQEQVDSVQTQTVPTARMRAGDFGELLTGRVLGTDPLGRPIMENAIYDPLTTRVVNGQVVRDPFPNNVIPQDRFDPVAAKIQALIPAPTNSRTVNNFEPIVTNPRIQEIPAVKIDHIFNPDSRMSFYWSKLRTDRQSSIDGLPAPLTAIRDQKVYSHTFRLNYDHSFTPTLLVHAGAGYIRYYNPDSSPPSVTEYDAASEIGLKNAADVGFPRIGGLNSSFGGVGNITNGFGPTQRNQYWNDKLTGVLGATWVRGDHTYKAGTEYKKDFWIVHTSALVAGSYSFSSNETALPYLGTTNVGGRSIGFPYASFLLGLVNNGGIANTTINDYRRPSWSFYAQDTWKVTPRLTLDYGLRYDYTSAAHERFFRTSGFSPTVANPSAGGRLGGTAYEGFGPGRCNCVFAPAYKYAFGPRLGAAYQINSKTVLRAGWGISYTQSPVLTYVGTNTQVIGVGFNTLNFSSPGFGTPATTLANGWQYNPGDLTSASLDPGIRPTPGQVNSPPPYVDPNGGRPGRVNMWTVSLQREVMKDLVVEAAYVGNRGVWLTSGDSQNIGLIDINAINPETLRARGLDLTNAADRQLLRSPINSALAQSRGFLPPYVGFPGGQSVAQSLRPYPQFGTLFASWAPVGNSWYDALQAKVTKRYSHGLDLTAAFTWQKELNSGFETGRGRGAAVNNVFDRKSNKVLSSSSLPRVFVVGFNYETPAWGGNRFVRSVLGGWTVGGILRYQSGQLIRIPGSNNNLNTLIFRGTAVNRVPGEPLFLKDPNCGCLDPTSLEPVLNPRAWQDAPEGSFGAAALFQNDYRWMRRPDEQLSFGRKFRLREALNFHVRMEFFNVFNRVFLNPPASGNIATAPNAGRSGFGQLNPTSVGAPRTGQIVARLSW